MADKKLNKALDELLSDIQLIDKTLTTTRSADEDNEDIAQFNVNAAMLENNEISKELYTKLVLKALHNIAVTLKAANNSAWGLGGYLTWDLTKKVPLDSNFTFMDRGRKGIHPVTKDTFKAAEALNKFIGTILNDKDLSAYQAGLPKTYNLKTMQHTLVTRLHNYTKNEAQTLVSDIKPVIVSVDSVAVHEKSQPPQKSEVEISLNSGSNPVSEKVPFLRGNDEILKKFTAISNTFSKKIKELKVRKERVNKSEQDKYTPAIKDADNLILQLKTARNKFKKTDDLTVFAKTISTLFQEFESKESFKTNRSNPWFRTFISKPFEQLKIFARSIVEFFHKMAQGQSSQYNGTLFSPSKTDTTKKLNQYKKAVEELVEENKIQPKSFGL